MHRFRETRVLRVERQDSASERLGLLASNRVFSTKQLAVFRLLLPPAAEAVEFPGWADFPPAAVYFLAASHPALLACYRELPACPSPDLPDCCLEDCCPELPPDSDLATQYRDSPASYPVADYPVILR